MNEKFCVDCKHFKELGYSAYCLHPSVPKDVVYGISSLTCSEVRDNQMLCSTQAIWFCPKSTTQTQ